MKRQVGTPSEGESEEATSLRALKLGPLWQRVESYSSELAALGHVNKKAHDQYTAFTDQREALGQGGERSTKGKPQFLSSSPIWTAASRRRSLSS